MFSGISNVFFSIVSFVVTVGIREFATAGFRTLIMWILLFLQRVTALVAGFYYFLLTVLYFFTIGSIVK